MTGPIVFERCRTLLGTLLLEVVERSGGLWSWQARNEAGQLVVRGAHRALSQDRAQRAARRWAARAVVRP